MVAKLQDDSVLGGSFPNFFGDTFYHITFTGQESQNRSNFRGYFSISFASILLEGIRTQISENK